MKEYCGMAILKARDWREVNKEKDCDGPHTCDIISTPLEDAPMHADVLYANLTYNFENKTFPFQMRAIAKWLAKTVKYFPDPNPLEPDWKGAELSLD